MRGINTINLGLYSTKAMRRSITRAMISYKSQLFVKWITVIAIGVRRLESNFHQHAPFLTRYDITIKYHISEVEWTDNKGDHAHLVQHGNCEPEGSFLGYYTYLHMTTEIKAISKLNIKQTMLNDGTTYREWLSLLKLPSLILELTRTIDIVPVITTPPEGMDSMTKIDNMMIYLKSPFEYYLKNRRYNGANVIALYKRKENCQDYDQCQIQGLQSETK